MNSESYETLVFEIIEIVAVKELGMLSTRYHNQNSPVNVSVWYLCCLSLTMKFGASILFNAINNLDSATCLQWFSYRPYGFQVANLGNVIGD